MRINYRPEIDGLRAIAVIAVILYHAQINLFNGIIFPGGFIGVDIFFVISGYLITSLITKELIKTEKFSFTYFYERRFRRIIPVLFFVMLFSLPLGWALLLPTSLVEFSKSIISSVAFGSNFFFYLSEIQYAAENSFLKPFLHTWSLSVEEQFYIIFPLIFLILYRYVKKYILQIIIATIIVSLIAANFWSIKNSSLSFYILPTRGWELLSGSLLAYLENTKGRQPKNLMLNQILTLLGLLLVFFSFIFFDDQMLHPSYISITPIIGVCLIIWFSKNTFIEKILSTKIFVGTGLISYSLYLWHYPSFAFARLSENFNSLGDKVLIFILIIFLSILSFFIIEKPCRNKEFSFKKIFYIFMTGLILIIIYCNVVINKDGVENRGKFSKSFKIKFDNYVLDPRYYLENHHFHFETNYIPNNFNSAKSKNKKNKVLVVGNSFGADFFKIIHLNKDLFDKHEFELISPKIRTSFMVKDSPYQVHCLKKLIEKNDTNCGEVDFTENILKQFYSADIIILSTFWENEDLINLKDIISLIDKKDKKVIIVNQSILLNTRTNYNFNPLDYFVYLNNRLPNKEDLIQIEKKSYLNLEKNFTNRISNNLKLKEIADNSQVKFLDMQKLQCNSVIKTCDLMTPEGFKIYWDQGHNTYEGAKFLGKKMKDIDWLKID